MALVSYDVSDASDYEEEEENSNPPATLIKKSTAETPKAEIKVTEITENSDFITNLPEKYKTGTETTEDETALFSVLPTPKSQFLLLDSDLSKRLLLNQPKNKEKTKVKISVPSLSELEDELPRPTTKKVAPSAKGSGLFAVLPPPKNSSVLNFVPDRLKRIVSTPVVKKTPVLPKPPVVKPATAVEEEEDEEDDDTSQDFLGLHKPKDPEPVLDVPLPELPPLTQESIAPVVEPLPETHVQDNEEDYVSVATEELALDEEALQKLCGGSRRKRTAIQAELIDVAEKDVRPDKDEWLIKALTEEKRTSSKKSGGPSGLSKRKHQITYLAYQAKANEQDLQNQWAANRMTKRQTQSKYGF